VLCCALCSAAVLQIVGDRSAGVSEDHDVHTAADAEETHGLSAEVRIRGDGDNDNGNY